MSIVDTNPFMLRVVLYRNIFHIPQVRDIPALPVSQDKAVNVVLEEAVEDLLKKYSKKGK
ncbi:MAG: hypothetical protein L6290_12120 [Thermodesulfovibrionales bacterium]|nr:hypothetical protein [Thermodesulfovibrionales bacterium]